MEQIKYAGLIECSDSIVSNWSGDRTLFDGFHLKKILFRQHKGKRNKESYPQAELVHDSHSIINDASIELVIVSAPGENDLNLVAQAIEAGKQVRVL